MLLYLLLSFYFVMIVLMNILYSSLVVMSLSSYWCFSYLFLFSKFILRFGKFNIFGVILFCCSWINGVKFLIGVFVVGSMVIFIILWYVGLIGLGVMFIEFMLFFMFVCIVLCFYCVIFEDEWWYFFLV